MDVKLLHNLTDALKVAGCFINEDFVPILYSSLIRLQSENHFESVYLWGRIETLNDDYYVAYGYQNDPLENRIFFYTQNVLEWNLMPTDWTPSDSDGTSRTKTKFYGDPRYTEEVNKFLNGFSVTNSVPAPGAALYDGYAEDAEEERKELDANVFLDSEIFDDIMSESEREDIVETESVVVDGKNAMIKEENRLAVTVKMIDDEGHIVPRGFFYKHPNGKVVKAPYFKGLNYSEIGNEQNFLHVNQPRCARKGPKKKLRPDYNGSIDFLESIAEDVPKGCWVSRTASNRYLIVHNLLWPGSVFVQDMNTGAHGFFYNGDGVKNLDLPFMIEC